VNRAEVRLRLIEALAPHAHPSTLQDLAFQLEGYIFRDAEHEEAKRKADARRDVNWCC
jgi:hypothetical protein